MGVQLFVVQFVEVNLNCFEMFASQTIFSVEELNDHVL